MSETTQIPEASEPATPTRNDLAGLFKSMRPEGQESPQPEGEPEQAPDPEAEAQAATEEEAQDLPAEQDPEPEGEPDEASALPVIPAPIGMTTTQAEAFGQLSPDMQQFVAAQEASRTLDYQAKTTKLAQQSREAETLRAQYNERLSTQIQTLEAQTAMPAVPPDPTLRETDPELFDQQFQDFVLKVTGDQQKTAELGQLQQHKAQENERATRDFLSEQRSLLPDLIPESTDPAKFATIQKDVAAYAGAKGYSDQELAGLRAKDLQMLYQSMLYERAKTAATGTGKRPKASPPRSQQPGTSKPLATGGEKQFRDAKKAFNQKRDKHSLAAMFRANR